MVQIELTPKQVEELKDHYILELEKLQQRSSEIMGILNKLIHGPIRVEKPIEKPVETLTKRPGRKVKVKKPAEQPEKIIKRRGRPSNNPDWSNYIIQILKEKDKPLSREQILKSYQKQNKVDLSASKGALVSLNQSLQRLRVKHNLITSTRLKGKKGSLYSLTGQSAKAVVRGRPRKQKEKPVVEKKQRAENSKHNWPQFIVETLEKNKRLLSLKDFLNHAIVHFNIPPHDKKATYGRISPVLTQMVNKKDKIRTAKKEGFPFKFYGLNEWFNSNNELITVYQ